MNLTGRRTKGKPDLMRLLDTFDLLVSFDSPSYGERKICNFLKYRLSSLGVKVEETAVVQKPENATKEVFQTGKQMPENFQRKESPAETAFNENTAQQDGCGNLYGYLPGTLDLPPLLLSAHMDTVEPSRNKEMVFQADGRITSAGNSVLGADDCAGLASIIEALTVISENHIPHRPVEILFTAAEEPYCAGAGQFDFSKLRSKEAYVFDLAGPVGGAAYQAPTIISFTIRFCGRSAHAGFEPESGIHAVKAAALAVARIPCGYVGSILGKDSSGGDITPEIYAGPKRTDAESPQISAKPEVSGAKSSQISAEPENRGAGSDTDRINADKSKNPAKISTINIGTISGGTADNIVPDACTISGEIRSYSDAEAQGWLKEITTIAEQCAESTGASAEVRHTTHFHAYCTDLSHPVVRRFESACGQLNLPVNLCRTFGGSDNNHLAYHGIAGLVVATAMNNCHSCEEYTTIDELDRAANLALALILS